ncbi:MAG: hypothetical protein A2049_00875 [Elusimicrobia bacterium GWA2_62_23]|nr:MAG: hypothetical protein A2049_00875 [Elusimicrobia bacterium GWA2_62_23]OGR73291.1 MAG: hypothetical protein A2179_05635 [Elusimicrobia bacterium GWC2_63_65]
MKNLTKVAAAGLLSLNFASYASAESGVLNDAGFSLEGVEVPAVAAAADSGAGQAPDVDLFRYFGYGQELKAVELEQANKSFKGVADVIVSVDLASIKNAYLKPNITFTTGAGTKVHVSGTKAANCPNGGNSCADKEKFFLVLTTDKGQSFFVRAMEIVNAGIFASGSKTVTIDNERYVVKVLAKISAPENSKLEIKGPRGVALTATLKQIGDAVAAKGVSVQLSKTYKLAYGNEIVQGPQGARFTEKMLVLMIPFPVVDASTYYIFDASDIKPAGAAFPSFEKGYGFKLQNGKLDVYRI